MRKTMLAVVLLLATQSVWAGVSYEFVQSSQSDIDQFPATNLTGRAIIDDDRSRVDFVSGNIYAPGAYVISTDGSRTMLFVDPVSKSYSEVNAAAIAATYGATNIGIQNFKVVPTILDDHPLIAGIPTEHHHLTITYDMTLQYGTMPLTQKITEEIDKWVTTQFGEVADSFFAGGSIKTGNPKLDALIEAETRTIKGFPLRQSVTVKATNPIGPAPGSQLKINTVRTQQRELLVTSIRPLTADASVFRVPAAFKKIDSSELKNLPKTSQMTVLSFEGDGKP